MLKGLKQHGTLMVSALTAAAAIIVASLVVSGVSHGENEKRLSALSSAIKKAAVQCYAIEGYYPPGVEYLEDNYGLIVNREKYLVHYEAFASNIMPQIEVYSADSGNQQSEMTE